VNYGLAREANISSMLRCRASVFNASGNRHRAQLYPNRVAPPGSAPGDRAAMIGIACHQRTVLLSQAFAVPLA
jgi:hypothetical protein